MDHDHPFATTDEALGYLRGLTWLFNDEQQTIARRAIDTLAARIETLEAAQAFAVGFMLRPHGTPLVEHLITGERGTGDSGP